MTTTTDTLVIGAGSAGLFAALGFARRGSVMLLECGPDLGNPLPDWALHDYALPDAHYHRYVDAETGMAVPQGRGLGGGSTVNSAAALRGQPWCYDDWSIPGWSWEQCLDGFRAIEADEQFGGQPHHGADGPIPITRLAPGPLDEAVFAWCQDAGHAHTEDHNAPGALGFGMWTTNRRAGGRWGTWAGVTPAARAAGVTLRADTTATRLVFDASRCIGADVRGPSGEERIAAGRTVVCAGAFGTPALLMASGIGPEAVLARLGVPAVAVREGVGVNLQDHPWCLLDVDVTDPALIEARPVSGALLRYELEGAAGSHLEAEIFPWQTRPYDLTSPPTRVSFSAALMVPESRGRFAVSPEGPDLRVGLLTERVDAERMAEIVARTAQLIDALADEGLVRVPADAWWRDAPDPIAAVRAHVGTYNHHCGTCRMGDPGDPGTVVAADLSVLGTDGLSVADSSILPRIPRANTNLAAMMIGHRSAELVP